MTTTGTSITLTQGFAASTRINKDGSKYNSGELFVGNVTGYAFIADAALEGTDITVNNPHAWNITASSGADTINGGSGNDTINGGGSPYETMEMDKAFGNDGKDVFQQSGTGTLSAEDYTYGTDKVKTTIELSDDSFAAGAFFAETGEITSDLDHPGLVSLANAQSDGYYKVNVIDGNNKNYNVWFGGTTGSTIDASDEMEALVILGHNNEAADLIYGGSGADTIYMDAGDSVDGGKGNDLIVLGDPNNAIVLDSASGKDTVDGFMECSANGSTLYVSDASLADLFVTNDGSNITLTDGSSKMMLTLMSRWEFYESQDSTESISIIDQTGTMYNVAIAVDEVGSAFAKNDNLDVYVGSASVKYDTRLTVGKTSCTDKDNPSVIDLSNGDQGNFGDTDRYYNISNVAAAAGDDATYAKLIGTTGADTIALTRGAGNTTVWGGAGNDTITLSGVTTGKNEIAFVDGDSSDVVRGFNTTSDSINIVTDDLASWSRAKSGNLTLTLDDSSKILAAGSSSAADEFTIQSGDTTYVAEIGMDGQKNTLKTSANVGYYYGGNQTDTLSVSTTYTDTEIWLDNRNAKGTVDDPTFSSIEVVDGSGANGSLVIGGAANTDESLVGGQGDTTLWGGVEGNDTLKGGSGATAYLFGIDEGSDVITNTKSTDKVLLYSVADADVASSSLSGSTMTITLTSGDTLTIQGISSNSVNTFELLDGTYTYDYSKRNSYTKGWTWTAGSSY